MAKRNPKRSPTLFDLPATGEDWQAEWVGMPAFVQEAQEPYQTITIRLGSAADVAAFAQCIGQPITPLTKSLWFPALVRGRERGTVWVSDE